MVLTGCSKECSTDKLLHAFVMMCLGLLVAIMLGFAVLIFANLAFGYEAPKSEDNLTRNPHGAGHHYNQLFEIFDGEPARLIKAENRRYENIFDDGHDDDYHDHNHNHEDNILK